MTNIVPVLFTPGPRLIDGTDLNTAFEQVNTLITGMLPGLYTGNWYFVNATTGHDSNPGTVLEPKATLQAAHDACTANNNDVVAFMGTVRLSTSLNWSKAQTHLIGMCAPIKRGKRARISVTGTTGFNKLVNVTASGCNFRNFGTFYGWIDSSTALLAWSDTGGRNSYDNVEFLGFGDATVTTGSSNLTGSRAFYMNTSTGESTFRSCVFGVDTTTRNATNYTTEFVGGAPRITFTDCDFEAYLGASGGSSSHVLIGASGIDRYMNFTNCRFMNSSGSGATTMTQCFNVSSSAGGMVLLNNCTGFGFTHWETTASTRVLLDMGTVTAHDGGIAVAASPS